MKHRKYKSNIMFILIATALLIIGCVVACKLMAYPYYYRRPAAGITFGVGTPVYTQPVVAPGYYNEPVVVENTPSVGFGIGVGLGDGYYGRGGYWGGRGRWGRRRW